MRWSLRPFLGKWHLIPGVAWQPELEDALRRSKTVAVWPEILKELEPESKGENRG